MGYPMAVNLRKGLGKDKAFIVCDVNIDACKQFKEEASQYGNVEIVDNGYQAAQAAVSHLILNATEANISEHCILSNAIQ